MAIGKMILEYLTGEFSGVYSLYWVESKLALVLLSVPTLYLVVAMLKPNIAGREPLTRRLEATLIRSKGAMQFRGLQHVVKYWATRVALSRAVWTLFCLVLLFSWHLAFSEVGESCFLRFDKSKFGVLITNFSGADLTEVFGSMGFREKVLSVIDFYSDPQIREAAEIKFSNKHFNDSEQASDYAKHLGADMAIWGYAEQLSGIVTVTIGFTPVKTIAFTPSHNMAEQYDVEPASQVTLSTRDGSEAFSLELAEWIDYVSVYTLTVLATSEERWDLVLKYVDLAESLRDVPDEGDLFFWNMLRSLCYDRQGAWDSVLTTNASLDSLAYSLEDFPGNLPSSWKLGEAKASLELGDTLRAIAALRESIGRDTTNRFAIRMLAKLYFKRGEYAACCETADLGLSLDSLDFELRRKRAYAQALVGDSAGIAWSDCLYLLKHNKATDLDILVLYSRLTGQLKFDSILIVAAFVDSVGGEFPLYLRWMQIMALAASDNLTEATRIYTVHSSESDCLDISLLDIAFGYKMKGRFDSARVYVQRFCSVKNKFFESECSSRIRGDLSDHVRMRLHQMKNVFVCQ